MSNYQPLAMWNGEIMPLAEVRVSVLDRAYLFGDAAYEVLRFYKRKPFLLAEHERRMARSLRELGITPPPGQLGEKIQRLIDKAGIPEGSVYVQISRGEGPRSHVPPTGLKPNELIFVQEVPSAALKAKQTNGISVLVLPDIRWHRCDIKSINLLGNCLAAGEAKNKGYDEAVLVDGEGIITEGAHTTFFGVRDGALVTIPLARGILPGITRDFVMDLARKEGIPVVEESLAAKELERLSEVFLTGTVSEIFPVVKVGDRKVGRGEPGPITRQLQRLYASTIAGF